MRLMQDPKIDGIAALFKRVFREDDIYIVEVDWYNVSDPRNIKPVGTSQTLRLTKNEFKKWKLFIWS